MTPDDLAALHAKCFDYPRPWSAAEFRSMLTAKGVFLLCCKGGFIVGRAVAGEAELLTLAVDPACQRQGRGRALLGQFEVESSKRDAIRAFLEVAENNHGALRLYHSAGYRESGRRPDYYRNKNGTKIDATLLEKPLI